MDNSSIALLAPALVGLKKIVTEHSWRYCRGTAWQPFSAIPK
jgi:hypothetical protein